MLHRPLLLERHFHLLNANALRVGLPCLSFIGPCIPLIRAQNDRLRAPPSGCGAFSPGFPGLALLYEALPLALRPPVGDLPSLRFQASLIFALLIGNKGENYD